MFPASLAVMIASVVSDRRAAARRERCVAVRTCSGFWSSPVAATMFAAGTMSVTS
jgi:hypothetical protein